MKRTLWFERKFDFDFPVGLLPAILERLRGTPARLEELVSLLPSSHLTKQIGGDWSIQEHIGHLWDLEELHDRRIDDYLKRAETLQPADTKNEKTYKAKHNAKKVQQILSEFRTSRKHFVDRLEGLDDDTLAFVSLHPRLKQPMRVVDFAFFVAEHDDHHITSMREISRVLSSKQ